MNPWYGALVYGVWFLATYYIVIFFLLLLTTSKEQLYECRRFRTKARPKVSIIVPAFNEEGKIGQTIQSLKRLTYPSYEVIVISDGSTDGTSDEVRTTIGGDKRFRFLDNKKNKGKAACLNEGIRTARGTYVAGMDADSVVDRAILEKTLPYFEEEDVGAVTVTVEVTKAKGLLHRIIDIEYTIGLSLFLKVFSLFNCVFVTPGPFSIYRKKVLEEIEGFDEQNITEDLEIAYRIHKAGYQIRNCLEAKVYTIVPPTFKQVYVQRKRWYSGAIQTLFKHRDLPFKRQYGLFAYFVPFNYLLVALGLILFVTTTALSLSNLIESLWYFQYTNFNFLDRLFDWEPDILSLGRISFIGYTAFIWGIVIMVMGLMTTRRSLREKKLGMLGYPFLFFLYQIWWIGAVGAVVRGKKVKWR